MRRILLLMTAFVMTASTGLFAQGVTTSTLAGSVKDKNGAVPGANIVAVHEPTGTTYGTVSTPDGKFVISNMRVGGPYKITISFVGYQTQTYGDINLKLGETYVLNHTLAEEGTQLEELVVTGVNEKALNAEKNGAVTNISAGTILAMPTISRSINDMVRMTPQATSYGTAGAIGGGNYRQNNFTIDGSDFNNSFGIGNNLPGNGNPMSLDAIEQISINLTPYDIRQSGFIGSAMNAVTRSGTNTFTGSAYTFFRTQGQQGDQVQDETKVPTQKLEIKTYGFRIGGPIIKNKLFFFVNYETSDEIRPGQTNFAATAANPFGSSPNISKMDVTTLDSYSQFLRTTYGYETGGYQNYNFKTTNTKAVARVDWNINNNHRLSVRYSQVENKTPFFVSTSRSPLTAYGATQGRNAITALTFENANYFQENNLYSVAAELNSTFGKFANMARLTYTDQNEPRSSNSSYFPFVDILDGSGSATNATPQGNVNTSFGYEPFTYGNLRKVSTYSFIDNVSWNSGKHAFTVGGQYDFTTTKNGFQRFGASYYTFNSFSDFQNGLPPRDFGITYSLLPGYEQAFPTVKTSQASLYGQDEYTVNDRLKVSLGLRLDMPMFNETKEIKTHPLVAALSFEDGRKIDTGVLPDSKVLFSPRVGFNFDVKGDRSLVIRGGTGVFTGKIPMVWIVSQSGDAGMIQFNTNYQGRNAVLAAGAPLVSGPITAFNPNPEAYRPAVQPAAGTAIPSTVSALNKDFNFPQTWKSSLGIDIKLPYGFIGGIEAILNKDLNVARGYNPNLAQPVALAVPGYPDNRLIWPSNNQDKFINPLTAGGLAVPNGTPTGTGAFNPVTLVNSQQGYYASLTFKLEKPLAKGLFASAAYVRSESQVLFDGSGDQLLNTWSLTQISQNANYPNVSYAGYVVPDRFIASVTYRKEWLKNFATGVSLFYEGSVTGRYSYTYSSDFNRDGQTNDLIYIPRDGEYTAANFATLTTSAGTWNGQDQVDLFYAYIKQDPYLSKHQGEYAERNGATNPWRNQLDLRIVQDIFTNLGGRKNTLQFTLDISNFGNFLNKDWGVYKTVNATAILVPVTLPAQGSVTTPTFRLATPVGNVPLGGGTNGYPGTYRNLNTYASTYYMQFGLRYSF
jgi:hypothetical protein